jgi:hypothetical protein
MLAIKHKNVRDLMPDAAAWTKIKVFIFFFWYFNDLIYKK